MQPESDAQLLRAYAERGAEAAFTELVHRHTNLVYSAAWRQVDSAEAAAEIAQSVFIGLARGAQSLVPRLAADASLAGWLCRSARNLSLNHRRDEFRRQTRERQAMEQIISIPDAAPDWNHLRRVLDDVMAELDEPDYDALVLRYFQQQDFRAVGVALGVSDDTAQKRVARALEKLRDQLSRRGISTPAAALSIVISANAVQTAPAGLAATISTAALLTGTAVHTSTVIAAIKTIAMTTLQKTLVTVTVAALAGAGIYEARQAAQLREQNQTPQQSQAPLAEQNRQLQRERDNATNRLAGLNEELAKNEKNNSELLKLRGQIGVLQTQLANESAAKAKIEQPPLSSAKEYYNRANQHSMNHEYEAQLEDLNKAIELDPTMADAYMERGNLYDNLPKERGGDDKVLADFTRVLELQPNNSPARWNRANTYKHLRQYDLAIADWTTYIEGDTDFSHQGEGKTKAIAGAYFWRGDVYQYCKRDLSKAIADYTAALQLNPQTEMAHRARGQCYEALGETEKAQADFAIEPKSN